MKYLLLLFVLSLTVAWFSQYPDWTTYNTANTGGPASNMITSIDIEQNGIRWIGTYDEGLAKYNGSDWTIYNTENSDIPDNKIKPYLSYELFRNTTDKEFDKSRLDLGATRKIGDLHRIGLYYRLQDYFNDKSSIHILGINYRLKFWFWIYLHNLFSFVFWKNCVVFCKTNW